MKGVITLLAWLSHRLLTRLTAALWLGPVSGLEHLPARGPYIIAPNHASFIDHFLIGTLIWRHRREKVCFLTKRESFASPISRVWHLAMGCVPVNRGASDMGAYKTMRRLLEESRILCIYPEGTRSLTGRLQGGKAGAVKLALAAGVPIIPVGLRGTFRILPKGEWVPRLRKAEVRVGAPVTVSPDARRGAGLNQAVTDLMGRVAALLGQPCPVTKGVEPSSEMDRCLAAARYCLERERQTEKADRAFWCRRALWAARTALRLQPESTEAQLEEARAIGRLALCRPLPARLLLALPVKRRLEAILSRQPEAALAHYLMATWYLKAPGVRGKRYRMAAEGYRKAVRFDPENPLYRYALAQVLVRTQERMEARHLVREILSLPEAGNGDGRIRERAHQLLEFLEEG